MWLAFSLLSALLLGAYDICKKIALRDRPVLPVLFLSSALGGLLMLPEAIFYCPPLSWQGHAFILAKSLAVALSWGCAYAALKRLPISVATPAQAFGPVFTVIASLAVLVERPQALQWVGIATFCAGLVWLALASAREEIRVWRDPWFLLNLGGVLLGVISGLLDKFLMSSPLLAGSDYAKAVTLQAWFSVYTPLWLLPVLAYARGQGEGRIDFRIGPWIPAITLCLLLADRLYFMALGPEDGLLSVVTCLRRASILVSTLAGGIFLGERNLVHKLGAVLVILAGTTVLLFSSY